MKEVTKPEVLAMLKRKQGDLTRAAYAAKIGVCYSYLYDVEKGLRNPGNKILAFLGLEKQSTVYVEVSK